MNNIKTSKTNTTVAPLGIAGEFVGKWEDVDDSESVKVSIYTDKSGMLYIEQTSEESAGPGVARTVHISKTVSISSLDTKSLTVPLDRGFFKVRFVNDSGEAQGVMSLQTRFGSFSDVGATEFSLGVAQGSIAGITSGTKFGNNSDIDIGTAEDIWEGGGDYTGQPIHSASAETVESFSSSTADTSAGTGARTIRITGLDENWTPVSEVITLNGTTGVISTNTYRRLFRVEVLTAGSGGGNAGALTVRHSATTANVFAGVVAGRNQSAIACYTVPAGKTAYITRVRASIGRTNGSAGSAVYTLRARKEGEVYRAIRNETLTTNYPTEYALHGGIKVTEKTDIKFRCESVSDNNTSFAAAIEYYLIDN